MTKTITWEDDDGVEWETKVPASWVVCPKCEGEGKHVNPSIDGHGLSAEDFAEDPDFAEEYLAGRYDVTCYECKGLRVVAELADLDTPGLTAEQIAAIQYTEERERFEAEYRNQCRHERMMGY